MNSMQFTKIPITSKPQSISSNLFIPNIICINKCVHNFHISQIFEGYFWLSLISLFFQLCKYLFAAKTGLDKDLSFLTVQSVKNKDLKWVTSLRNQNYSIFPSFSLLLETVVIFNKLKISTINNSNILFLATMQQRTFLKFRHP